MPELKKDVTAQDEHKMLELMIFHREMLKPALVTRIFKAMGDARREKGELSQAREFYEKALDVRPGDMDLINAIIQVSEASGDEDAIKAAREKLKKSASNRDKTSTQNTSGKPIASSPRTMPSKLLSIRLPTTSRSSTHAHHSIRLKISMPASISISIYTPPSTNSRSTPT